MAEKDTEATIERLHCALDLLFSGALFELVERDELSEQEATTKILKAIFNEIHGHIYIEETMLARVYQVIEDGYED
ncbi:hypothetical protein LCGC14_2230300 [marine sediment metagenome]|uniref:Uncharacterized protein n=1 Tax=marine sediment metagenome TaxID=412755 RepID=A0A0F9D8P3_9ZZZZ